MEADDLRQLLDAHAAALILYARQWSASPEDIVQEAFLKLATQPRPPGRVVSWLYRVVRNAALDAARSARRRRHHETVAAARTPSWFQATAETALDGAAATQALRTLPEDQREIVVAHLWGGLTFEEIADLIGASASTAHRKYIAALTTLRERLGEQVAR